MNITHKSAYSLEDMTEAEFKGLASFVLKNFDPDSNCTADWAEVYDKIKASSQDLLDEDDYALKRPSVEFVKRAKEIARQFDTPVGHNIYAGHENRYVGFLPDGKNATISNGELIFDDDYARVGDVISFHADAVVPPWCVGKEFKVVACDDKKVWFMVDKDLMWIYHGRYTIVRRVSEDCDDEQPAPKLFMDDSIISPDGLKVGMWVWDEAENRLGVVVGVKKLKDSLWATIALLPELNEEYPMFHEVEYRNGKWSDIFKSKWTDGYSNEFCIVDPEGTNLSTSELVEMLATREGVEEYGVEPHEGYFVSFSAGATRNVGPARILVVTD